MNAGHAQFFHKTVEFQNSIRLNIFRRHIAVPTLKGIVRSRFFIEGKIGRANHEEVGGGLTTHKQR